MSEPVSVHVTFCVFCELRLWNVMVSPGAASVISAVNAAFGILLSGQSIVTVAPVPSARSAFTGTTSNVDLFVSSVRGSVLI